MHVYILKKKSALTVERLKNYLNFIIGLTGLRTKKEDDFMIVGAKNV